MFLTVFFFSGSRVQATENLPSEAPCCLSGKARSTYPGARLEIKRITWPHPGWDLDENPKNLWFFWENVRVGCEKIIKNNSWKIQRI